VADADFQAIFDKIVTERGGRPAFDVVGLAVARALAAALTSDPPGPPATIGNLVALLPAPKQAAAQNYDLRNLTDKELATLEFLAARAAGLKPPKPPRVHRTAREQDALEAAQFIDRIARGDKKPTADEIVQIRNYVYYLIRNVADPYQLFREHRVAPAVAALQAGMTETDAVLPAATAAVENRTVAAPRR
jgi:hypothetical protein